MDESVIRNTLYKIATDPLYRAQFESDPVAALAALGITVSPSLVPVTGIQLPSNADILSHLDAWTAEIWGFGSSGGHMPKIWLGLTY